MSTAPGNRLAGPLHPTPSAALAHRPPGGGVSALIGGLLADWPGRNRDASLPLALCQLEAAGDLGNVRLAIAGAHEGSRGPVFMDSGVRTDPADLALIPGDLRERTAGLPGAGPAVLAGARATHHPAPSAPGLPYQQDPEATTPAASPAGDQVTATAIPYFQWDNRDGRAMRVWLPPAPAAP
jgi:hypothetical protein